MTYMIMENHLSYSVVLDKDGNFIKVANMGYEVGELCNEIYPIRENKSRYRFFNKKILGSVTALVAGLLIFLASSLNKASYYGSIYIEINPSVQVNLNQGGKVKGLKAINSDGKKLIRGYRYRNKDFIRVSRDLIDRSMDLGYLEENGQVKIDVQGEDEYWNRTTRESIIRDLSGGDTGFSYGLEVKINGQDLKNEDKEGKENKQVDIDVDYDLENPSVDFKEENKPKKIDTNTGPSPEREIKEKNRNYDKEEYDDDNDDDNDDEYEEYDDDREDDIKNKNERIEERKPKTYYKKEFDGKTGASKNSDRDRDDYDEDEFEDVDQDDEEDDED